MAEPQFVIYGSTDGYTAVTNPIRRKILQALADRGDLELPDLVEVTGRSKSTLSSIHVPNLIERGLVEEHPHPTDGRKKRFTLVGRRIGSSELPVEELRGAVRDYVTGPQGRQQATARLGLAAIAAAPEGTELGVLRVQGHHLGYMLRKPSDEESNGEMMTISTRLDKMGVARTLRIDLEASLLDLELAEGWAGDVPETHAVNALAGFLRGLAGSTRTDEATVEPLDGERRASFRL